MTKIKRASTHIKHYFPLIGIFVAGIIAFLLFAYDRTFQLAVILAVSASYVLWGIVHHFLHKDLNWGVVFEYVVIALLGIVIVVSMLFRA